MLGKPLTCFDASNYGALVIADSEEEFYPEEVQKLKSDVEEHGLGVIVFAEWYNKAMLEGMKFYDDNTRSWCGMFRLFVQPPINRAMQPRDFRIEIFFDPPSCPPPPLHSPPGGRHTPAEETFRP